jgi:hypothetical protein
MQRDLFEDPGSTAVVRVGDAAPSSPRTRSRFNRLAERVRALQLELIAWQDALAHFHRRAETEIEPLLGELRREQRGAVLEFAAVLADEQAGRKLSAKRRSRLRQVLVSLANDVLEHGPDPEIEAVSDRYSRRRRADQRRDELALAEALIGGALGRDVVAGHSAGSIEELIEHASEHLRGQDEAAEGRARGAAEPRVPDGATHSVRDVFRRLSSALHPDREPDPAERARKTALMQRVNVAYGKGDLLELLAIQFQLEQIDPSHPERASEDRLAEYCEVLAEQEAALQAELDAMREPLRAAAGPAGWPRAVPRTAIDQLLDRDARDIARLRSSLDAGMRAFRDPATRGRAIDGFEVRDDSVELLDGALLAAALSDLDAPPRRRRPRGRR